MVSSVKEYTERGSRTLVRSVDCVSYMDSYSNVTVWAYLSNLTRLIFTLFTFRLGKATSNIMQK